MFGNFSGKQKIMAAGVVVLLILVGTAIFSRDQVENETPKDITTGDNEYIDPNSGETISDPEGKTPDRYGTTADAPIFLGLSGLLDYGVTKDQTDDYKYAIYQYVKSAKLKTKEVSINVQSVSPVPHDRDSESTVNIINFDIVLDRKDTYKVKMEYFDLSAIRLYLYDASGNTLVHDSNVVNDQQL